MLSILDRYILRELVTSVLAVTIVLLIVIGGDIFARVLQQVSEGGYPAGVMFDVLGLKLMGALSGLLPMALFLGEMRALGRLHHDSEMHVLTASGMGPAGLIRPVAMLAVFTALVAGLLSLWLRPWSENVTADLIAKADRSVIAAGLEAGRFTPLANHGGTIFVAGVSRDGTRMRKVYIFRSQRGAKGRPSTLQVVTARRGQLYPDTSGTGRHLMLTDGWQYRIPSAADNWARVRYRSNDLALTDRTQGIRVDSDHGASNNTSALWHANDPQARAKLAWRITAPVATLVLALLAIPLSRQAPRESRHARLLIGILCFFLYFNLLTLVRSMIGQNVLHHTFLIWVLHFAVACLGGWFLWRQYASRKV